MVESRQKGVEISSVISRFVLDGLKETLRKGKMVFFPSQGIVITPQGEVKAVVDLTPEELQKNPFVFK